MPFTLTLCNLAAFVRAVAQPAMGDARAVPILALAQLLIAVAAVAVASALLALRIHVPLIHLPFGLYTAAAISALLSGDALLGWHRDRRAPPRVCVAQAAGPDEWHATPLAQLQAELSSPGLAGLSTSGAAQAALRYGPNSPPSPPPPKSLFAKLLDEIHEPQQLLLLLVAQLFSLFGEYEEAALALGVVASAAVAETWTEARAKNALSRLSDAPPLLTAVLRDGCICHRDAACVVPGDVLCIRPGHELPADCRLLRAVGLAVDESKLTGESIPVYKSASQAGLPPATPLPDRIFCVTSGPLPFVASDLPWCG